MRKIIISMLIFTILAFIGCSLQQPADESVQDSANSMMQDLDHIDNTMNNANDEMTDTFENSMEDSQNLMTDDGIMTNNEPIGYKSFNQQDYEKSLEEGKIIFLNFYANWCPTCKAERPNLRSAFDEITDDSIVAYEVNYKDSETSDEEESLARKYGITYQHTKVIIKDDQVALKSLESWNKQKVIDELSNIS